MKSFTTAYSLKRRRLVQSLIVGASGVPSMSWAAYPEKPIRFVGYAVAGSAADLICRALATDLAKSLGLGVVIDNKPGAGGAIGIQEVVRAAFWGIYDWH
jgi:tripartite-type tricarboxylate transporter receptor subunit TctC